MKVIFQTGYLSRIKTIFINGLDQIDKKNEQVGKLNITNLKETNCADKI